MERAKVESSSISEIGYDNFSSILEIKFPKGSVFQYFNVPHTVVFALVTNDSIGSYFAKNIKNNYKYKKIEEK